MSELIVQISEELHNLCQKARAYDEVRDMLEEVYRANSNKLGIVRCEKIVSLLNKTPSSRKPVPDEVLTDWDER